ncbi:Nif3-like dinuclear metal center hexameric protein [Chitinophaga filiformis]|uniref:Putative GTP cyclohydrolase 1 type 2, NIF3 family n=1 Tax=Chitinophaga filiformis TaxID=104663 RepID=A0A1G7S7F2_CHIFI|nr:Nif3-like dinuclear metal center hexameric protein [Chitinophaga filiformis]SDG18100.1 Putative GTP cyclohydrolase 1 type 2, NIF3 family [Chitinophaga filiformis]
MPRENNTSTFTSTLASASTSASTFASGSTSASASTPTSISINRRKFIAQVAAAAGSAVVLASPLAGFAAGFAPLTAPKPRAAQGGITVGQIMDLFIKEAPGAPFSSTIDTLKSGNRDVVVTGIVTTMFATVEVIRKAIALNANFIIAHEPTFYNHTDETTWLEKDDVYRYKADLLKKHNIVVWRNHDYIHSVRPDGVRKGLVDQLGWQQFEDSSHVIYNLPAAVTLKALIEDLKKKLNIEAVRYVGDPEQQCKKVLLLPGASGGRNQIQRISSTQPDVLVCGEVAEWETAEYVRDARAAGKQLSLVVLGHIVSEEPGSEFMAKWLQQKFPEIKTTHIPTGSSLSFL